MSEEHIFNIFHRCWSATWGQQVIMSSSHRWPLCPHTRSVSSNTGDGFHLTNSISQPLCYLFRGFALLGNLRPSQFQHQISFNQHIALRHLQFLLYACMQKTSPPPVDPLMAHRRRWDKSEKRARTICWCVIFFPSCDFPEYEPCLLLSTGTGIALSGVTTDSETSRKCSHSNSSIHLCRWCSLTG